MFCVAYFECIVKCYFKFILILFQLAWATVICRLCSLLSKATVSAVWAWYVLPTVFFLRVFMYLFFWRIKWWWWWWWWCGGTKAPVCQMCRGTWRCRNLACNEIVIIMIVIFLYHHMIVTWEVLINRHGLLCLSGQVGSGSNAAIAVAASRAIGATLEVTHFTCVSLISVLCAVFRSAQSIDRTAAALHILWIH